MGKIIQLDKRSAEIIINWKKTLDTKSFSETIRAINRDRLKYDKKKYEFKL